MLGLQHLITLLNPRQTALLRTAAQALEAFGSQLTEADQIWVTAHLDELPEFFKSKGGAEVVSILLDTFRSQVGRRDKLAHHVKSDVSSPVDVLPGPPLV